MASAPGAKRAWNLQLPVEAAVLDSFEHVVGGDGVAPVELYEEGRWLCEGNTRA